MAKRAKNPFTGTAEYKLRFGPRVYQAVKWPEALHQRVRIIEHETGLSFSAVAIRALARYTEWYFKEQKTEKQSEQRAADIPNVPQPEIRPGKPDADPF